MATKEKLVKLDNHFNGNSVFYVVALGAAGYAVIRLIPYVIRYTINSVVNVVPIHSLLNIGWLLAAKCAVPFCYPRKVLFREGKCVAAANGVSFIRSVKVVERGDPIFKSSVGVTNDRRCGFFHPSATTGSAAAAIKRTCSNEPLCSAGAFAFPQNPPVFISNVCLSKNSPSSKYQTRKVGRARHSRHLENFTIERVWQAVVKPLFGSYPSHMANYTFGGRV